MYNAVYQVASRPLRDAMDMAYLTGQRPADVLRMSETDIDNGIISYQSPLAKALIKHEIGDEVEVNLPRGLKIFKILDIGFFDE